MPITKPQFNELVQKAWNNLSQATGLTNNTESGIAYNMVRAFVSELTNLWDALEQADLRSNLSTAAGYDLDNIGNLFGVTRRQQRLASTVGTSSKVKFINNSSSRVTIPMRTLVWPQGKPNITYETLYSLTIEPGMEGYVDVESVGYGSYYNVGAGVLTQHNFPNGQVTVTNEAPIVTGQDVEDDDTYRTRITRQILRKESSNLTAIREALLDIPGVRDAIILNMARGTGTLDVLILTYDREVPEGVLAACQEVLNTEVAAGISAIAKAPKTVPVDVTVRLKLSPAANFDSVRAAVSVAIRGYIDNLPIEDGSGNGTLVYMELAARVQEASEYIISSDVSLMVNNVQTLRADQQLDFGSRFVSRALLIS
jgi:uncharacterized phage protein gp47/JayE